MRIYFPVPAPIVDLAPSTRPAGRVEISAWSADGPSATDRPDREVAFEVFKDLHDRDQQQIMAPQRLAGSSSTRLVRSRYRPSRDCVCRSLLRSSRKLKVRRLVIITVFLATGISFADYELAKNIMTFLLGPATVALAVPLYKNRQTFFKNLVPAGAGLLAGSLGTMIAAGLVARIFRFTPELVSSIAVKSTTVPIAVAKIVHGNPTLTAVLVVIPGMLGASFGPWLMDRPAITNPISRGLALGTVSHGQGTAQAATESELSGAIAGVAMGLSAVCTSLAAPWIVPLLIQ